MIKLDKQEYGDELFIYALALMEEMEARKAETQDEIEQEVDENEAY